MAVAMPILKVVGVALSAKSAYKGIKEGNLFQAVVGAVGAYYGISSLAQGAAQGATTIAEGAKQRASTAGANVTDKLASEVAATGIKDGAKMALKTAPRATDGIAAAAGGKLSPAVAGSTGASMGAQVPTSTSASLMDKINTGIQEGAKRIAGGSSANPGGLLRRAVSYAQDHPAVMQTGLYLAGGAMQGKAEEEMMDREERFLDQRRERMGTPGDVSAPSSIAWNPQTRRFEMGVTQ